jgi:hypothetical protein
MYTPTNHTTERMHPPVHQGRVDVESKQVETLALPQQSLAGHVRGDGELERGAKVDGLFFYFLVLDWLVRFCFLFFKINNWMGETVVVVGWKNQFALFYFIFQDA